MNTTATLPARLPQFVNCTRCGRLLAIGEKYGDLLGGKFLTDGIRQARVTAIHCTTCR